MSVLTSAGAPRSKARVLGATPYILVAAVPACSIALSFWVSPAAGVASTFGAFLLMAIPGVFIGLAVFGWDVRRHPESLIFGVPLGLMISGYVALMLGYIAHWSAIYITIALLILIALTGPFAARQRNSPLHGGFRPWTAADYGVLGLMGLAVLGFVAIPFSRVGELTPDGHAYTWLFGFDFILRAAYSASITISLPIDHIHMAGVPLHMYLVGYVLPAFSYSIGDGKVHMHAILLVTEVLLDVAFVACLFAFLRLFARSRRALLTAAVVGLAAYSYYGWFVIARHFASVLPAWLATKLETQFAYGEVSHLFQRLFMVEPQAILALCVFLFVITVLSTSHQRFGWALSIVLGLAIGIEFGIDCWLGLTLAVWSAGVQILRLRRQSTRVLWIEGLFVVGIAGALWATYFMAGMLDLSSGNLVSVGPNWWAFKFGMIHYIVEYGPMLVLGVLGLRALQHRNRYLCVCICLIAALALFQDLFISVAEIPRFRMGNRLLPIALLAGTASLIEHTTATAAKRILVLAVIVLALPTLITDIRGASNVSERRQTFYVTPADLKACEWIRTHLPTTAIIQGRPDYIGDYDVNPSVRGENEISLIPSFALRRSALGAEYPARSICAGCSLLTAMRESDIDRMFRASDVKAVTSTASKYNIDYLYVGPYEEDRYPAFLDLLKESSSFDELYGRSSVHIFRIHSAASDL